MLYGVVFRTAHLTTRDGAAGKVVMTGEMWKHDSRIGGAGIGN